MTKRWRHDDANSCEEATEDQSSNGSHQTLTMVTTRKNFHQKNADHDFDYHQSLQLVPYQSRALEKAMLQVTRNSKMKER
jgi:hypothetical protein